MFSVERGVERAPLQNNGRGVYQSFIHCLSPTLRQRNLVMTRWKNESFATAIDDRRIG